MNTTAKTFLLTLIIFCLTVCVSAATFTVNNTADTQDANAGNGVCADASLNCSFRAAISEANALAGDDIITLPAGTYTQSLVSTADEQLNAGGDWNIRSNVTINGAGAATTILQAAATPGTATERVLRAHFLGTIVTINGVTIRHGNKVGTSAIDDVGGGVYDGGAFLHIDSSVITLNSSSRGGGVFAYGTFNLSFSTVTANSCVSSLSECYGGGIGGDQLASLNTTIVSSTVSNNTASANGANGTAHGAGIALTTTFFALIGDTTVSGNRGFGTGNGGSDGSGLYLNNPSGSSTLNISTTTNITGNSGSGTNVKGSGIAVFNNGTLNGVWNRLTLDGNTAGSRGGGLLVENGGTLNINVNNSTISNNNGGTAGGGVMIFSDAATAAANANINFLNTTISGNNASGPISNGMNTLGGGVRVEQIQPAIGTLAVNFNYCTVANNTADVGGGIIFTGGIGNLKNTIVAGNTADFGPDIFSVINSQDYNHISNVSNAAIAGVTAHNSIGNAMLGPLQINGSGPRTHLPLPGSPVIDKIPSGGSDCGTPNVSLDSRSITRPQGGVCDKGAVEVEFPAGPFSLSGNVRTSDGRPIRNVGLTVTGGSLPSGGITVYTGSFGNYVFPNLPGAVYTVLVQSKKFNVGSPSQVVTLNVSTSNINFTADPGVGRLPPLTKGMKR